MTPKQDVIYRLSIPLGCGYIACRGVVFGQQPLPEPYEPKEHMQEWENSISEHNQILRHKQRRLREIKL